MSVAVEHEDDRTAELNGLARTMRLRRVIVLLAVFVYGADLVAAGEYLGLLRHPTMRLGLVFLATLVVVVMALRFGWALARRIDALARSRRRQAR